MFTTLNALAQGRIVLFSLISSLAIYLVMVLITLPHLQQLAGELKPFDLLPQGYDAAYAMSFLEAIKDAGRSYYLYRQIPLDLIYPALFAFTFAIMWLWLLSKSNDVPAAWRWGALLPMLAGISDYIENGLIIAMLYSYPEISEFLVSAASFSTIFKSITTSIYFIALLLLVFVIGVRRYRVYRG